MNTFRIFDGLTKSELNYVVDSGVICPLESGKVLFKKGEAGREMYVILTGKIDIVDEYNTYYNVLAELGPGEVFGEMAMFEKEHTRSAHALVKEPAQVLVLSEEKLNKLVDKKMPKQFLTNIIAMLCHRLRATNSLYMHAKYGEKLA